MSLGMSDHPTSASAAKPWLRRLAGLAMVMLLLGVFLMYTQPEFMMQMANQVWACF
ncbi:MAG: hypothetical protein RLZZ271_727 [Pseudomonadota bacterium]|jgi:hypothetical protein